MFRRSGETNKDRKHTDALKSFELTLGRSGVQHRLGYATVGSWPHILRVNSNEVRRAWIDDEAYDGLISSRRMQQSVAGFTLWDFFSCWSVGGWVSMCFMWGTQDQKGSWCCLIQRTRIGGYRLDTYIVSSMVASAAKPTCNSSGPFLQILVLRRNKPSHDWGHETTNASKFNPTKGVMYEMVARLRVVKAPVSAAPKAASPAAPACSTSRQSTGDGSAQSSTQPSHACGASPQSAGDGGAGHT